jgi:hypothetical protein
MPVENTMNHINPERLLAMSEAEDDDQRYPLQNWEEEHLLECHECQNRLEILVGQVETALDDEIAGNSKW